MQNHKDKFKSEADVLNYAEYVFDNATTLRKAGAGSMYVSVEVADNPDMASIIRLYPSEHGDYYNVETLGDRRKTFWNDTKNEVLAERSEPSLSETASNNASPGAQRQGGNVTDDATNASISAGKGTNNSGSGKGNVQFSLKEEQKPVFYSNAEKRGIELPTRKEIREATFDTVHYDLKAEEKREDDINKGGNTLLIGRKFVTLHADDAAYVRKQKETMPAGMPWAEDFPDAVIHTTRKSIESKYKEDFEKAKAGDTEAAARLVEAVVKPEKVLEIAERFPNAVVVYPHAEEASGKNKIPEAYAREFKRSGLQVSDGIYTINEPHHTGANDATRLTKRARYGGEVEAGREYILVDDQISSGASLRDLKDYIEANGGKVVFVSGLTASYGGTKIAQSESTRAKLAKAGITDKQLQDYGIATSTGSLTNAEANRYARLANSRTNRGASEGSEGSSRVAGQQRLGQETPGDVRQTEGREGSEAQYSLKDEPPYRESEEKLRNFKKFFGDWENDPANASKVVDEDGEPLPVYHWSGEGIDTFDLSRARTSMDVQGFFFQGDPESSREYGDTKYAVYLDMRNPYIVDSYEKSKKAYPDLSKTGDGIRVREELQAEGYDGIIRKADYMDAESDEYIVFEPTQIKSATENNGEYSKENGNIHYSLKEDAKWEMDNMRRKWENRYAGGLRTSDVILNQDNVGTFLYGLHANYNMRDMQRGRGLEHYDEEQGRVVIDYAEAKKRYEKWSGQANSLRRDLMIAKQFATDAAAEEIQRHIDDIDYADKFYTELVNGRAVFKEPGEYTPMYDLKEDAAAVNGGKGAQKSDAEARIDKRIAELSRSNSDSLLTISDNGSEAESQRTGYLPDESGVQRGESKGDSRLIISDSGSEADSQRTGYLPDESGVRRGESLDAKVNRKFGPAKDLLKKVANFVLDIKKNGEITAQNFAKKFLEGIGTPENLGASKYVSITADGGKKQRVRIADHSGNAISIIKKGGRADEGYSIVVKYEGMPEELRNKRFKYNKYAKVVEYVYENPDATRLEKVAKSIFNLFDSGEYIDLASADEINRSPNENAQFDLKEEQKPVFYSNAERTVEGLKQEKATPEQWKSMLQKAGGLKAEEDKWMGLSEWLDGHNAAVNGGKSGRPEIITIGELSNNSKDQSVAHIEKGDYRVVIAKNAEGNWVLSAFDMKNSKKSKLNKKNAAATGTPSQPEYSEEAGAVTSNSSAGKVTNNSGSGKGNVQFSLKEEQKPVFYSNAGSAERAVEGLKQEKATPEQWKSMMQKAGGLKAEEDKWMGLSEWLDSHNAAVNGGKSALEEVHINDKQSVEGAKEIVTRMSESAETMRKLDYSPETFDNEFPGGKVMTPIGEVKMGRNQYDKIDGADNGHRPSRFGMAAPTLMRPDIILEKESKKDGAERQTKYLFIKSFVDADNKKVYHFEHVTVSQDGNEVSISSHDIDASKVRRELRENKLLWTRFSGESAPSDGKLGLDNLQENKSELTENVLNPQSNLSGRKGTNNSGSGKGNVQFSLKEEQKPVFYNNAERAVEGLKQEKATPEQWKSMMQKAGGLKAEEDKWMGLSEWLDGRAAPPNGICYLAVALSKRGRVTTAYPTHLRYRFGWWGYRDGTIQALRGVRPLSLA